MEKSMRKTLIAAAIISATPFLGASFAVAQDSPFSGSITFVSDYMSRGFSWSAGSPAVQGDISYSHASGFYAGVWASSISDRSWGNIGTDGVEFDLSAGFAGELGDFGYDLGAVRYIYPGSQPTSAPDGTDSTELYIGLSWNVLTFKYARDLDWDTNYYSLDASYPLAQDFSLDLGVGALDPDEGGNYTNWKIGVSTAYAELDFGLHYVDSDENGPNFDRTVVFSVGKSF